MVTNVSVVDRFRPFNFSEWNTVGGPVLSDEELLRTYDEVYLVFSDDAVQGLGKLSITSRRAIWLSSEDIQKGFAFGFPSIVVHAISTDPASFPRACIYCMLESQTQDYDDVEDDEEGDEENEGGNIRDDLLTMRFVPSDASSLEDMFKAFCDAAGMNPSNEAEEEGHGEFFYNQEEVMGNVDPNLLAHLSELIEADDEEGDDDDIEELIVDDPDRFDDPEGDDEEPTDLGINGGLH